MATQADHTQPDRPLSEQETLDFELIYLLEREPHLTQREIAERLGISLGRANYCLKALAERGAICMSHGCIGTPRAAPARPRTGYVPTRKGLAQRSALTRRFLKRKLVELERLKSQIESLGGALPGGEA